MMWHKAFITWLYHLIMPVLCRCVQVLMYIKLDRYPHKEQHQYAKQVC